MKTRNTGDMFLKCFMVVLSFLFLLPSTYKLFIYFEFRCSSLSVEGVVTRPLSSMLWGGRPMIEFVDHKGGVHEFRSRVKTHWFSQPKQGDVIDVLFLPDDPDKAIVDNWFYHVFLSLCFISVGFVILFFVLNRKTR